MNTMNCESVCDEVMDACARTLPVKDEQRSSWSVDERETSDEKEIVSDPEKETDHWSDGWHDEKKIWI